ncbi:hypothetical protein DXG01_016023 [Tephrocybe rancida]|nr:hypothetical protein DXG01_016023 [Tephrocybe rancida]
MKGLKANLARDDGTLAFWGGTDLVVCAVSAEVGRGRARHDVSLAVPHFHSCKVLARDPLSTVQDVAPGVDREQWSSPSPREGLA